MMGVSSQSAAAERNRATGNANQERVNIDEESRIVEASTNNTAKQEGIVQDQASDDQTGTGHTQEVLHTEPEALQTEDSPAASYASTALEQANKDSRRRKDSYYDKRHQSRSESHRHTGKSDKLSSFLSIGKSGLETAQSKESLVEAVRNRDRLIDDLREDAKRDAKSLRKLRREISDLAGLNEDLQQQLEQQDSQIRIVQDQRLKNTEERSFRHVEDDHTVRNRLRTCMMRWKLWAREFAVPKLDDMSKVDQAEASKVYQFVGAPHELFAPKYASIGPIIILNAALAKFLTENIIQEPFFCLFDSWDSAEDLSNNDQFDKMRAFFEIYEKVNHQGDESLAHTWRTLTLRMVDPESREAETQPEIYDDAVRRKSLYYDFLAKEFSESVGCICRPSNSKYRVQHLHDIIRETGELFSVLWKRKISIEPQSKRYLKSTFTVSSNELEAHPALRLEESDTRMDGASVLMVIQPSILAFGDDDGGNYDRCKVWAKAVVWLGNPPAPRKGKEL